jgi:hypothetical protein
MSRSHILFRDVPVDPWVDRYEKSHQNPINRVFHTFGIPMIAVSIPLFGEKDKKTRHHEGSQQGVNFTCRRPRCPTFQLLV